ncbi:MAG: ribonuclease H-like YkuK family protein [Syntrophomonas sp.]|uniref:ribonuclease H-like YkuK family protein n=1 Tax=Syntrophomonas sp. TaxID=2053627 RepID=UPI00262E7E84|nr:ribonuclease H-like YkuK family protein [Syntrophomonas sp.]MDD2510536.1 ribonuclease H-like YkuK family protein [Syntrophomonas sp.]MDD3879963.1 ribonuclease H-like YkuK family protein [Syntrophomonas sp.]MDD4626357.1 ribonuclease H-like YkuK family protein [Syntrophomonas sp.]
MIFNSPSKGELNLEQVVIDILKYISEDITRPYKLIVGSDSHPGAQGTCYVSAIIIHRTGKGARYFYNKMLDRKTNSLRQRIFYEASLSLDLADRLSECLKKHGNKDMKVEIHLDVGIHGDTKELIKEVTGMIVGSGFAAKIKPDACAASTVADRYTK